VIFGDDRSLRRTDGGDVDKRRFDEVEKVCKVRNRRFLMGGLGTAPTTPSEFRGLDWVFDHSHPIHYLV